MSTTERAGPESARRSMVRWSGGLAIGLVAGLSSIPAMSAVPIDNKPLTVTNTVPGNMVLLPSVEWPTVVTHANAPGVAENSANYTTATAYAGYFNSELCYAYHYDDEEANRYFYPVANASSRSCSGKSGGVVQQRLWSGNFLNWSTMQAIDTFRLALTGGYRVHRPEEGSPPSVTLTGADGSSVTKATSEMPGTTYLEKANSDRFDNGYTPLRRLSSGAPGATPSQTAGIRIRIGGLRNQMWFTPRSDGFLGDSQAWNDPNALDLPVTDGKQSAPAGNAVAAVPYDPAVHELPNSDTQCPSRYSYNSAEATCTRSRNPDRTPTSFGRDAVYAVSVRVQVCDGSLDKRSICTKYGSHYKPEGLLQRNAKKTRYSLFAYLTEDGGNNGRHGGVMRARQKFLGPVTAGEKLYPDRAGRISGIDNPEWDPVTGVIINNPDAADAAATSDRIGGCGGTAPDGSSCVIGYSGVINYLNRFGQINTGRETLKAYDNLSEMYYTALRYLRGVGNTSSYSALNGSSIQDYRNADGLPVVENWYHTGANNAVSRWDDNDLEVGSDADPVLYQCQTNVFLGIGDTATQAENKSHSGNGDISSNFVDTWLGYMEGESSTRNQNATAALAYWGHVSDIRPDVPNTPLGTNPDRAKGQSISTYWVDVVELNNLKSKTENQYYLATKYGGYAIPEDAYNDDGSADRENQTWFNNNRSAWTAATQTAKAQTGLGGTGDFYLPNNMYLANNGEAMIAGLNAAFQKIADDITGSGGSFASNTTKLEVGARTYQAKYVSNGWGGRLTASDVDVTTGTLTPKWDASDWLGQAAGDTKINSAATVLDYSQRKILYRNGSGLTNFISGWDGNVKSSPALNTPSGLSSLSQDQLRYILGDRTHEQQSTASGSKKIFRNRRGMLGDIINSTPVYVGKPNANLYAGDTSYASFVTANASRKAVVYVGANDGMLHAFQAPDSGNTNAGKELFAFMPTEAMAVLQQHDESTNTYPYWDPDYDHAYSVDGEITVADVKDGSTWKTVLVGTMGRGGKSIFALDVTDPDDPELLWEKTASDGTVGAMLGNSLGRPIIAQVADGDWRVFLGNGPNSSNGTSALIMLDAITGSDAGSLATAGGSNNGMAPVNVWDAHGALVPSIPDGLFDTVYAGDMNGNLWKFDLDADTATKLFVTQTGQPITAAPLVARNPYNPPQTWIFFGTGRYLSMADTSDAANAVVQSWYGIIDRDGLVPLGNLRQSRITHEDAVGRVIEKVAAPGQDGWYINLQSPAEADGSATPRGERMVVPNIFQGLSLVGTTRYPVSNDPCSPTGKGSTMAIDPFTGGRLGNAFFDINDSGAVGDSGDYYGGDTDTPYSGVNYDSGPNNPIFLGSYMYTSLDNGTYSKKKTSAGLAVVKRVSWRELLNVD